MERTTRKMFITLTFVFGLFGVALMIAAFATDHWIKSAPERQESNQMNETSGGSPTKNKGNINFGLFRGHRVLDYGSGGRLKIIKVKELIDFGLFSFGLWVSTIVTLALGVVWGLVSIMFAIFNIFGKPIETITGPAGLYLWNGLALIFSLLACLLYVGLFVSGIQKNILPKEDVDIGWTSEGRTYLDYSFYLVVGAAGSFLFSVIVLMFSGLQLSCSYSSASEKEVDGMILY
ncbi:clarin-3-like isoform X2 [Gigantopelta aegis]|uniref:clarin-3-like isoform X2 n=1 Tax=Gigantopelta aegis TaxID=1735272 RepID=UPI001B88B578|nr:clarin-3-like isoform X2 [Gigantopelta aegis]